MQNQNRKDLVLRRRGPLAVAKLEAQDRYDVGENSRGDGGVVEQRQLFLLDNTTAAMDSTQSKSHGSTAIWLLTIPFILTMNSLNEINMK